jgi:hypothetical protein
MENIALRPQDKPPTLMIVGLVVWMSPGLLAGPAVLTPAQPNDGATGIPNTVELGLDVANLGEESIEVTFYGRRTVPAEPGPDFTVVAIPDTQEYAASYLPMVPSLG